MTAFTSGTFQGVTLWFLYQPTPNFTQAAEISVRHIPGGSVSYIDRAGMTAPTFQVSLYFPGGFNTPANGSTFNQLMGQVGAIGSLVYNDFTYTATLMSLHQTQRYLSGEIEAQAQFTIG